jgi:hypothetical protein
MTRSCNGRTLSAIAKPPEKSWIYAPAESPMVQI